MAKKRKDHRNVRARRATEFDALVGETIRARRVAMGMSQTELATACGITFQQVQKYENGANRVSVSRLSQIATALNCQMDNLLPTGGSVNAPKREGADLLGDAETVRVAMYFNRVKNPTLRKEIANVVRSMAKAAA